MSVGKLAHLQINVTKDHLPFYRDLFSFLAWTPLYSDETGAAFNSQGDVSIWFGAEANDVRNDIDGPGMNHMALAADSQAAVDATVAYLQEHNIELLFETPRHRPEYSSGEGNTYYQVMFASPDGILFEHVYTGPKQGE